MSDKRKFTMQDLSIQAWDLDDLKPSPDNHKNHTEESVAKLAKSIADIGQIQPCVVDKDGEIIAGHGRLMAARKLGMSKIKVIQVPVDRATAIKARIADNLMSNNDIDHEALDRDIAKLSDIVGDVEMDVMVQEQALADLLAMNAAKDLEQNVDAISNDISGDVKIHSDETEALMNAADDEDTPLKNVFGFTKVKPPQARVLRDFMAYVMHESEEDDPARALVDWAGKVMAYE